MERLVEVLGVPFFCARDNTLADLMLAWGALSVSERKRLLKDAKENH